MSIESRVTQCETKLSELLNAAQDAIEKSDEALSSVKYLPFQVYLKEEEPVMYPGVVYIDGVMNTLSGSVNKNGFTYLCIHAKSKTASLQFSKPSTTKGEYLSLALCYVEKNETGQYDIQQITLGAFSYMTPPVQDLLAPFYVSTENGTSKMFLPDDGTVKCGDTIYPIKGLDQQQWMTIDDGTEYWCWVEKGGVYANVGPESKMPIDKGKLLFYVPITKT